MDKDLVVVQNNQVVTSSLQVAKDFGKEHKNVLSAIREILVAENQATNLFHEDTYENRGKQYPMFYMNRDGFSLLVMGFTGSDALHWKLKYIGRFNAMEKALQEQANMPKLTPNPKYRSRMIGTAIRDIGKTADSLEKVFGVRHSMALNSATDLIGKAYGFDVEPVKKLIPPEEHPDSLNPAKIGTELGGVSANKVNKWLEKLGFQSKIGGDWKLTDSGKQYGSAVPYTNNYNGHSGYRVMWSEKVIPLLRDMKE